MRQETVLQSVAVAATIVGVVASVQAARLTGEYRRVMRDFRAEHPECAHSLQGCPWTNGMRVVPHHIAPVMVAPWLAACPTNLVALCDPERGRTNGCHWLCGHGRNWKRSRTNVWECVNRKEGRNE